MSADDDDEPQGPADRAVEPAADGGALAEVDAPAVRQPPGPDDRPIIDLPPPETEAEDAADREVELEAPGVEAEPTGADPGSEPQEEPRGTVDAHGVLHQLDPHPAVEGPVEVPASGDDGGWPDPPGAEAEVEVATEPVAEPADLAPVTEEPGPALDAAAEPEPERPAPLEAAAPSVAQRRARRRRRLLVGLLLVSVVSTAFAVMKAGEANDLRAERDDRRAIELVAARFGSAYLSYDFAHVEESGRAVTALGTARFSRSYAAERAPGIQQLFSSRQTTTRATTTEVFVGSVGSRTARALVVVDVTATSPTDGEQRLDDVTFVLDLARTSVGWRVDQVDRAPQASLTEGTPAPAP